MPALQTAKELRAKRANLASRMKEILDAPAGEGNELSSEQRSEFDRLHAAQETMLGDITRIENHEALAAEMAGGKGPRAGGRETGDAPEPQAQAVDAAFDSYLRRGVSALSPEHRTIMEARFALPATETRGQTTAIDTAGGYLVPEGFFNQIVESRLFFGGMRQSRATIIPTASGNPLPIPTNDDTSNTGALVGEGGANSEQDMTFGQVLLNAYLYSSKIIKVSRQLLNDSAFPLQPFIAKKFAQRLGRIQNTHFTTGDGASKPQGVVTGSSQGVQGATGQTTSVIYNDLVDLEHSVDRDYRENAEFMMADSSLKVIKKLKDGEGRPLWVPGLAMREPDSILGYRYVVNNDMAAMSASAKSILFGDFSQYYIRDVQEILVLRLDERYADNLQVGFLAFARCDGKLVDAGTDPIKHYANSAA